MELNGIGFTSLNTIFEMCKEKYPNKEQSNKKVIKKQIQTDESAIYEDMLFVGKCIVLVNLFTEQIKCKHFFKGTLAQTVFGLRTSTEETEISFCVLVKFLKLSRFSNSFI